MLRSVAIVLMLSGCIYAQTAKFTSSDKWAEYKDGNYLVRNDVWNAAAGTQTLYVNSHSDWWIHANHPGSTEVKAYAHVAYTVNKAISAIKKLSSSVGYTVPSEGVFNAAYDIWADSNKYEIMVWLGAYGGAGPLGASVEKATVGGHTWDVHKGTNGANDVFSFIISSNIKSGSVDILAILEWIKTKGWFGTKDVVVSEVQFGWEVFDTKGKEETFKINSYSVTES